MLKLQAIVALAPNTGRSQEPSRREPSPWKTILKPTGHHTRSDRASTSTPSVISAVFNRLELRLLGLFMLYVGLNDTSAWLFRRLNDNNLRLDILERNLAQKRESDQVLEAVRYFAVGFAQCAQNRNILLHSTVLATDVAATEPLTFFKATKAKPIDAARYDLTLTGIRRVADEMNAYAEYAAGVIQHIIGTYRQRELEGPFPLPPPTPLPGKPHPPQKLTPQETPTPKEL